MRPFGLLTALFAAAVVAISAPAIAGPIQTYSATAFKAAQKAGKPILIDVHADWCPTCRRQAPTILEISKDPAFAKLVIFKIGFDKQVTEREALSAHKQSTLIVYKGTIEKGRATGIVDRGDIRTLAAAALK
jgi:thioredoxin 1